MTAPATCLDTTAGDAAEFAAAFVAGIEELICDIGLPTRLETPRESDIAALGRAARRETDTGYPLPRYMTQHESEAVLRARLPRPATDVDARLAPVRTDGVLHLAAEPSTQ